MGMVKTTKSHPLVNLTSDWGSKDENKLYPFLEQ